MNIKDSIKTLNMYRNMYHNSNDKNEIEIFEALNVLLPFVSSFIKNLNDEVCKNVTIQDIVNANIESGVDDLEINVISDNRVEIGYWSFAPVTVMVIENNVITEFIHARPKDPEDYIFVDKALRQRVYDYMIWTYQLIDNKVFIDTADVWNVKGVRNIFNGEVKG